MKQASTPTLKMQPTHTHLPTPGPQPKRVAAGHENSVGMGKSGSGVIPAARQKVPEQD